MYPSRIFLFVLLSLFFISKELRCQTIGLQKLNNLCEEYKTDKALQHAQYSFCIMDAKTGKIIKEYNSQISLVPASTMKILTTGAIIGTLGANYKFETKLLYTGKLDSIKGIIFGDLVIKGSGDPSLNSNYFRKKEDTLTVVDFWATILKKHGIKKITGNIIGDASCFDDQIPQNWIWGDMGNYFGAGACGLSYNDNKYSVYFNSYENGAITKIAGVSPEVKKLTLINEVIAGGKEDNAVIYGGPNQFIKKISGTIPANQSHYEVEGAIPDPALFCAEKMLEACRNSGIEITGNAQSAYNFKEKASLLYVHKSPTLDKLVYFTNLKSNNQYAESFLKTIALKKDNYGTTEKGCEEVINFWKGRGVDVDGLFMNDGSGLSRSNGISTLQQTTILSKIYRDSSLYKVINPSLPVAGVNGSLANLCKGTFAEKNLRAKSGYITRARGYCGYVKTKSGQELCFSVLFNNYSCTASEVKAKIERLLQTLVEL